VRITWNCNPKRHENDIHSRVKKALLALLALAIATAVSLGLANRVFFARYLTYPRGAEITRVDWYEPLEDVEGAARPAEFPPAKPGTIDAAALEAAERYADEKNSSALLVLHDGKLVLERYWRSHGPEALSNGASMTKTLLGLLIGFAIEDGKIANEDEPASKWIHEWRDDARREITIKHLLTMTSGLRSDGGQISPFSDMVRLHGGTDALATILRIPLARAPGLEWEYSNLGSQLLGLVLESATNERFASYLSRRLWAPLGAAPAKVWLDRPGGLARTYCCFFARTRDWARVGQAMLEKKLIPAKWLAKMTTPSERKATFGYHLRLGAPDSLFPDTFWLDGKSEQRVYVVPSKKLVIVRVGEDAKDWDNRFLPETLAKGVTRKGVKR
jgi:CubicO group peptidase (beta-lactamase class C family)